MDVVQQFGNKHGHPEASALILFGVWATDSLYYLSDVDARDDLSRSTIDGHRPDIVDIAHARWATGTCITALDVCAAALGRVFCHHTRARELSIADYFSKRAALKLRPLLPVAAVTWIDAVQADAGYQTVKTARDSLTHARVIRHFNLPRQRVQIQANSRIDVPTLINRATDTATRHVCDLLQILPNI
ncbi:MAG TPA: hypothetical protein VGF24_29360 [Vicinamibacterales bacterium]|jgi:hypothetical protein